MKESIGLTVTINIIIIFVSVAFVFIIGIYSYSKAFKAASLIVKSLEKYEGYNDLAIEQINRDLGSVGYLRGDSSKCAPTRESYKLEGQLVNSYDQMYQYCIYFFDNDDTESDNRVDNHYSYGVLTYMAFDFTMFGTRLRVPVYAKTTRIYRFTNT
ncbi:MAG: hypothetical protein IJ565_03705 [Bacilli bacterium]|nr:hypothetical protein [Bacilli bacterium]